MNEERVLAAIWPAAHSNSEQRIRLGILLSNWRSSHELEAVPRIYGLNELLAGDYPAPNCPVPLRDDPKGFLLHPSTGKRMSIQTPWVYCPALVYTYENKAAEDGLIAELRELIPDDLGKVDCYDAELWR